MQHHVHALDDFSIAPIAIAEEDQLGAIAPAIASKRG
jgi:hypothetical protein